MINILLYCFVFTVFFGGVFCLLTYIQLFVFWFVLDKTDSKYCQKLIKITKFIVYSCVVLIIAELLGLAIVSQFFNVN